MSELNELVSGGFLGAADNGLGVGDDIHIIPHKYITGWPTIAPAPATPGEHVNTIGDFTLETGKTWGTITNLVDEPVLNWNMTGGKGSKSFAVELDGFIAGTTADALGVGYLLAITLGVVLLVKDIDCVGTPRYFIVGTDCKPANAEAQTITTGQAGADGNKGNAYKISGNMPRPLVYTGLIPTT